MIMMELLSIGYTGYHTNINSLSWTAHNIANINTEGFRKEDGGEVDLAEEIVDQKISALGAKANLLTMGSVNQLTDCILDILA